MKEKLERLNALRVEIQSITKEIENFPQGIVSDYAYSYPNGVKKVIPLVGQADCSHIRKRLSQRLKDLDNELCLVYDWLQEVEDEEIRVILHLRYIENLTMREIGDRLNYDKSVISRKIKTFFATKTTNTCDIIRLDQ